MDSPDQGVKGIPATTTTFENQTLRITITNAKIEYEGILGKDGQIVGTFKQGGQPFEMNLSKEKIEKEKHLRPQEPKKPYPYYSEDITFENKTAGITLAGTLTLPKKEGIFPVVVLISGSGPQNRDEELLGHKPFLVISDYLTRNGIAVLRYDDRGIAMSKGDFRTATTLDFATDAQAAVAYLKTRQEINKHEIGLIGHSEGGEIAPIIASKSNGIAFIVLLAGPGLPGDQLLLLQQKLINKSSGASGDFIKKSELANKKVFEMIKKSTDTNQLKIEISNYIRNSLKEDTTVMKSNGMTENENVQQLLNQVLNPWMLQFIKLNPTPYLEKVKCPVLALNGEKDLQVSPKENLLAIRKAIEKGGNKNVIIKELPNLNHLFQECTTGSPNEYASIEQTFSPKALTEILDWINKQTK
jgi:fermentation-respiration switch protein FrsA (DUF1100 family)